MRVTARAYGLDTQGHLNSAVHHQYGGHTRWECLRAAGISLDDLLATGVGPITLENTIRYHHELHAGDDVDITCASEWGDGRTFRTRQELRRADGVLAADIGGVGGPLDLDERRLVPDPGARWRAPADRPALLGL